MIRKLFIIFQDFGLQMRKKNISSFAASTAFFFFLSVVPLLMVICSVLPYTPLTQEDLIAAVIEITPEMTNDLITRLITDVYEKSSGVMSIAIVATIWSAAQGVLALLRGLNAINSVVEERNYVIVRMVAAFYTVAMMAVIVLSLLIGVFGNQLLEFISRTIPRLDSVLAFLMNFRFLLVWAVLTIFFSAVYAYIPNKKLSFKEQIPGAAFSAIAWNVFSWGFSIYVGATGSFSIYGSLSIIIIVMVWMYFCMYIIMVGAYLNLYFQPVNRVLMGRK